MESKVQAEGNLEPWHRLDDKVVMITGASSGLGWEFCLDLAEAGCRIVAAARRIERLRLLCNEINKSSQGHQPRAMAVELDVSSNGPSIEAAVQKAWDAFGKIDVLINNAGIRGRVHNPLDLLEEEWNDVVRTNLTGTWLVSKYVGVQMRNSTSNNINKGGGSIINISSIAGLQRGQLPGGLVYAATKAAVNTMTKVMALELGKYKIRVNSISPGLFQSEITKGLMQKEWFKNIERKSGPLRTFGTTDPALTSLLRYLIHDSSQYVSGNLFIADAGFTLPGYLISSSL